MVRWTAEQLRAIETTDKGVIVPAAAGSGKTAVLIERTARLLENPDGSCPAEKLLAVTFTKDAANQMKQKLRAALAERISKETNFEKRKWLERQRQMLPLAKITTINAFCLELVKDNLNEFDYRNGIKIADDAQSAVLMDEALKASLERMREDSPELSELLMDALTNGSDRDLLNYISDLYQFTRSLAFPDEWIKNASNAFRSDETVSRYTDVLLQSFETLLSHAFKLNERALFLAGKLNNGQKAVDTILNDLEVLQTLKAHLKSGSFTHFYDCVQSVRFATLRKPSDKKLNDNQRLDNELLMEQLKPLRQRVKDTVSKIKKTLSSLGRDLSEPMKDAGFVFDALCTASSLLDEEFRERKIQQGLADFGDVERMAMQLLVKKNGSETERTELAKQMVSSHAYKMLLIDEYQDVNNLQEMIFRALSDEDSLDFLGKNAFAVGDVKQSIYRFRLSNPRLFLNAASAAQSEENAHLCEIRLTRNFRSRANVINFVNTVFRTLMSEKLGETEYTEDEELKYGADYQGQDPPVELMLINDVNGDELKYMSFGVEELSIARRIKLLLEESEVFDGETARPCRPSDICVLSRNKDSCRQIAAALEYVGLKAQCEQSDGYMESKEIITMVNLLRVIDNPMKDMAMAAVMMSPILSFSADETAKLRMYCLTSEKSDEPKRLYQIILAASKTEDADEKEAERIELNDSVLEDKCRYAIDLISRLRFYSVSLTIEELIMKIYDETDFFSVASGYENSKQKRANLRLLTLRAAEYEKNSAGSISGFLRFLDRVTASKGSLTQASTSSGGAESVAVKTFHSSKGLEFPFVFLTSLNRRFNQSDLKSKALYNEQSGAGIAFMRHDKLTNVNTISHEALKLTAKSELLSEELRLLYVALTRAKEQLFIPFFLKEGTSDKLGALADDIASANGVNADILLGCQSFSEWLAAAVMQSGLSEPLLKAINREDLSVYFSSLGDSEQAKPLCIWTEHPTEKAVEQQSAFKSAVADEKSVKALLERFSFDYGANKARAAAKRSVTEIVSELHRLSEGDEASDRAFYPQLGTLKEEASRLSAAQRGTYTHLFMELADYERAQMDARAELERLVSRGSMSSIEAKGVYLGAVKAFFDGNFYKRMRRSDEIRREMKFLVRASDAKIDESFPEMISPDGMIQGIADCIFKEDDGYVLVDYKTDNFTDITDLDKYSVQLELYKSALDLILPLPVKACYIYSFKLRLGKEIRL